jgi:hypothetical protein
VGTMQIFVILSFVVHSNQKALKGQSSEVTVRACCLLLYQPFTLPYRMPFHIAAQPFLDLYVKVSACPEGQW